MNHKDLPRRLITALCCSCMFTGSFMMVGPATCLGAIAVDLGLESEAQKGLFLSAPLWGLGVLMLPSGWLADRLGFRLLLFISSLLQALSMGLVSIAQELWVVLMANFMTGVGRGMVAAPMTSLLCALYPERRTQVTSLLHGFYYVGLIFALALILGLLELESTWRTIFQVLGLLVLSYGIAALFVALPGPSRAAEQAGRTPLREIVRWPAFLLLAASIFFCSATEMGPANWLPYFIEQAAGASQTLSIVGLMIFGLIMAVGRISTGVVVQRWGAKRFFFGAGLVCSTSLVLMAFPMGTGGTIFLMSVLGLGISGVFPTILGYAGDRFPQAGASMFALLVCVAIVGGLLSPLGVGVAADAFGLRPAMGLLAVAPLMFMVLPLLIREPRRF
jgi:MFS family permease